MALSNVARSLTAEERAREPRLMHIVAWFDGHARGSNPNARHHLYPRRLTHSEAADWREGFNEGRRERVCHSWHGFIPCPDDHPSTLAPPDHDPGIYVTAELARHRTGRTTTR